ncbi:hypothetical protein ACH5RR_028680, partial [Cinchona calisaya]
VALTPQLLYYSSTTVQTLGVFVELGILDVIQKHGKPITLSELTSAIPINPSKSRYIYRLMRLLVNAGLFAKEKDGYAVTPVRRVLLKYDPLHGKNFRDFNARDPRFRKVFYQAMACDSQLITEVMATECKYVFEGLTSLVDIGGGSGTVAS